MAEVHVEGWREALDTLRAQGWQADLTCSAAPVQIEGRLPGGALFYFRARWDSACLAVGGSDPVDIPDWEQCEPHPNASFLPADEGLMMLHRLARAYADAVPETRT